MSKESFDEMIKRVTAKRSSGAPPSPPRNIVWTSGKEERRKPVLPRALGRARSLGGKR